jgi:RNA polymerase sigma-B factor
MRFVEDLTQQEIADRLGISQMQVSRRLRAVLDALRRRADDQDEVPPEAA